MNFDKIIVAKKIKQIKEVKKYLSDCACEENDNFYDKKSKSRKN